MDAASVAVKTTKKVSNSATMGVELLLPGSAERKTYSERNLSEKEKIEGLSR